jgi:hypothetical protein
MTFIVRLSPARGDQLTGVIERVRTGEKHRFDGLDGLGAVLARAVAAAEPRRGRVNPGPRPDPPPGAAPEA